MKSIIIILVICASLASAEVVKIDQKGIATDFLVDNVLNPLLNDLKNNTIQFIYQQLTSSLVNLLLGGIGKRDVSSTEYLQHVTVMLNDFKQSMETLFKKLTDGLRNLSKDELLPFLSNLKNEVKYEANKFLLVLYEFLKSNFGQVLTGVPKSIFNNISSVVNNFTNNLINSINNSGQLLANGF